MLKQTTANFIPFQFGEEALAASRQVWLASLGAAAVTRDWMQTEATKTFKTLVKEGTVVESRAVTFVGDQIEVSMTRANRLWKQTRSTVESTVKQAADAAVDARATTRSRSRCRGSNCPASSPSRRRRRRPRAKVARAKKAVKKSAAKVAKKAKRAVKAAA